MKYVKNNLDYSLVFKPEVNGVERVFSFDTYRVYSDTGNVASYGVTEVTEADYTWLCANVPQFKKFVEEGKLALVDKNAAFPAVQKADALESENAKLKKQLEEAKKQLTSAKSPDDAKSEALAKENESLKVQLEALKKQKKSAASAKKEEVTSDNGGF